MTEPIYEFRWPKNPCEIVIGDLTDQEISDMIDYCEDFNLELHSFKNQDVSDVSGKFDTIATFLFATPEDALAFRLKFKCK
jgi:hypothetical protein